jgi:predicted metal-binding membrane protein
MSKIGKWIDRLFNQHKFVRRGLVLWAIFLITLVTLAVFEDVTKITPAVVSALGAITALLTVVLGLYQWSRNKEDK